MPKKTVRKTPAPADPEQIARDAVREHFEQIAGDINAVVDDGSNVTGKISLDVMQRIEDALIAEHVAQGGKEPEGDGDFELFAQQAGYLVGAHIGLRLGAKDGAR